MIRFWSTVAGAALASAAVAYAAQDSMYGKVLLAQLVPLPLFMAGLSLGVVAGIIAGLGAAVVLLPVSGFSAALVFLVTVAVPAAVLMRQAMLSRENADGSKAWYPAGPLIAVLGGIGAVLALLAPSILSAQGDYEARILLLANEMKRVIEIEDSTFLVEALRSTVPAAETLKWMLTLIVSGGAAQWVLIRNASSLRPSPEFLAMELPGWAPTVTAVAGLAYLIMPVWGTAYSLGVLVALCLPFFLQGLAVVHAFNRKIVGGIGPLLIFYVLTVTQIWPVTMIFVLGVVEQFVHMRSRWATNKSGRNGAV